jgi:hypothetical protein
MLFKILPKKELAEIREKSSSQFSEKDLENLLAPNLDKIFPNLVFVSRQFSIDGLFLDILAFDREQNSPVIFELKKDRAREIVAQGFQYFRLLSTKKEKFIFEFLDKKIIKNHKDEIDWKSSKLIFVAADFSAREIDSASLDLPIELFRFKFFENDDFFLEKVERRKEKPKIGDVLQNSEIQKVQKEFKEYDRDFHRKKANKKTWQLFEKVEKEILSWDNLEENFLQSYISFTRDGSRSTFLYFNFRKQESFIDFYGDEKLNEKYNFIEKRSKKMFGKPLIYFRVCLSKIENVNDLDELLFILKQNYKFISEK